MTPIRPSRPATSAHPLLDLLERTGGIPLVIAACVAVACVAGALRLWAPM